MSQSSTPESPTEPSIPAPVIVRGGGNTGCLWFMGGGLGCLALLMALLFAIVVATGSTISGVVNNLTGAFSGYGIPQARVFDVPSVEPFTTLSNLTTIKYNYSNQINIATDMPPLLQALYGNSQVLIAVGSIEAGIDMREMQDDDIRYDAEQSQLTLRIPAARITNCFLNDQQTYVGERTSGIFAVDSSALDTESRRFALSKFLQQAQESDILADAQTQAALLVRDLAIALASAPADVRVVVISDPVDANVPLPETCQ